MVKIRLRRVGARKQPTYRVVVADSRAPRDGRFIETIGHYNPRTEPPTVEIREDRALYWLSKGAQPSGAVALFFDKLGLAGKLKQVHAGKPIEEVAAPPARAEAAAATKRRRARAAAEVEEAPIEAVAEAPVAAAEEITPKARAAARAAAAAGPEAAEAVKVAKTPKEVAAPAPAEPAAEPEEAAKPRRAKAAPLPTLAAMELSPRVAKALQEAGVDTTKSLLKLLAEGDDKLLALPGIGAKAVEEIRDKLAAHGVPIGE